MTMDVYMRITYISGCNNSIQLHFKTGHLEEEEEEGFDKQSDENGGDRLRNDRAVLTCLIHVRNKTFARSSSSRRISSFWHHADTTQVSIRALGSMPPAQAITR